MHELSIALAILDTIADEAARQGGVRVAAVHLRLGPLAGVIPDALRSAFELARAGSAHPTCELRIEHVPLVTYCPACAAERTPEFPHLCCPVCGGPTPRVVSGRELEVVALEVEV